MHSYRNIIGELIDLITLGQWEHSRISNRNSFFDHFVGDARAIMCFWWRYTNATNITHSKMPNRIDCFAAKVNGSAHDLFAQESRAPKATAKMTTMNQAIVSSKSFCIGIRCIFVRPHIIADYYVRQHRVVS